MIQSVVTRLETNCFMLKAMTMALAVALLAFVGSVNNPNWVYPLAGCLPIFIFWLMDAQYLRLGRIFRRLFNAVRLLKVDEPFSMNIAPYAKEEQSVIRVAFSWSILWFYLSLLIVFLFVTLFFLFTSTVTPNG